ncbi:uncharacterized protein P884DRAFT_117438 [Thermothelomyces heterothallicus CBS 202.75]|uniref:uncharacterized protein n=1 Tax=Thermothelomyces heterothallicus CBS 202.75 TaxID=1149848 RepID=UPI00374354FF
MIYVCLHTPNRPDCNRRMRCSDCSPTTSKTAPNRPMYLSNQGCQVPSNPTQQMPVFSTMRINVSTILGFLYSARTSLPALLLRLLPSEDLASHIPPKTSIPKTEAVHYRTKPAESFP